MHRALWVAQIVFGAYFMSVGALHFVVPDGLPGTMDWMYELSDGTHRIAGTAEILGGIGLIAPGLANIRPQLTVWAAVGLVVVMIGAAVWHAGRGEYSSIVQNLGMALVLVAIALYRWRRAPFPGSFGATAA